MHPDHTDAVFALVGAIGAAGLISVVNYFVQKRQLDSEADRLDQQLRHDRAMADLAELRQLLDEAGRLMWQTVDCLASTWVAATEWAETSQQVERHRKEWSAATFTHALEATGKLRNRLRDERGKTFAVVWKFDQVLGRLAIWLPRADALPTAVADYRNVVKAALADLPEDHRVDVEALRDTGKEYFTELREAQSRFVDLAVDRVGARIDNTEPLPSSAR